jgi:hypothetical protein
MSLVSIELGDSGILAAAGRPPKLVGVDGQETASPGFALQDKKGLVVGRSAERQARLHPQKVQHRFWDQLSTHALKSPGRYAETHAEIAFAHLARVWEQIKPHGNEVMFAIPAFFSRHQLGLLLGMSQELGIPVKGLIIQAVAAAPQPLPGSHLLFINVHLHRTEVTLLSQSDELSFEESATLDEQGLIHLYRNWAETIAEEFVRTSRFDPLHEAASEQALYDQIPVLLTRLHKEPTATVKLGFGKSVHRISLGRDRLKKSCASYLDQVGALVRSILGKAGLQKGDATLLMSRRFAHFPGTATTLPEFDKGHRGELETGAGALNLHKIWNQLPYPNSGGGAAFFTSRPWQPYRGDGYMQSESILEAERKPSHILYGNLAYPITEKPTYIQWEKTSDGGEVSFNRQPSAADQHATIQRVDDKVVLTVFRHKDIYVDNQALEKERTALYVGQTIRFKDRGEPVRLIACLDSNDA